jgi:ribose transport system substrate-binding protein
MRAPFDLAQKESKSMVQRIRRRMLVAGALAAAGLTGAKGVNATPDGRLTIAVVLKSRADPYFLAMARGAQNYQTHYASQFDLTVRGTATAIDTPAQIRIVDELINARTSAIVLAPIDSKALIPVVTRAIAAGVIVIAIDNPLDEMSQDAAGISVPYVGPDNRKGARLVGNYLAAKLKPGNEVGILEGLSADRNAQQRTAGYQDAMQAAGMKVVAIRSGDWDYGKGKVAASAMLGEHPWIQALLCGNDNMAVGAVDAVRDARRAGRIFVTGYDNVDTIKTLIYDGRIVATMDQFAERQAVFGVDIALKALVEKTKQQDLSRVIETPLQLVTNGGH